MTITLSLLLKSLLAGIVICGVIVISRNRTNLRRKRRQLEEARLQESITQLQLESLYAKINPAFLHNSLQAIADLALIDGERTREISLRLSRYFRYCINKEKRTLVSLAEEAEMTRIFLEFEQMYYKKHLSWNITFPESIRHTFFPRLLLQSLVENSIREAAKSTVTDLTINIDIQPSTHGVILTLQDNGPLFAANYQASAAIRHKLELALPGSYRLELRNLPCKILTLHLQPQE